MINLYNVEEGFKIENTKKKHTISLILCGVFAFLIVFFITYFSQKTFVMLLDILIVGSYFSYIFIYHSFIKKNLNAKYHLLAKIQHFDHEIVAGKITFIDNKLKTIDSFEVLTLSINNARTVFIELDKLNDILKSNSTFKISIVDNFIIGYEVIENV